MSRQVAVIFDLDGTLVDSRQSSMRATASALEQHGYNDAKTDEVSYNYGARFITPRRLAWQATGVEDDPCGPALANTYENLISSVISPDNTPVYDGILQLIQYLASKEGVVLGVLSNASTNYTRSVIRCHQWSNVMRVCRGANDVPAAKPSPAGLNAMLSELDIHSSNSVYVGDSPTDGAAASNANMHGIGVTWGNNSLASLESHFNEVVTSVAMLTESIDGFIKCRQQDDIQEESQENKEKDSSPRRRVSWQADVIDNEHMNKMRTDDEYWDGR